jgi:autotransporter-associated beta strand protein
MANMRDKRSCRNRLALSAVAALVCFNSPAAAQIDPLEFVEIIPVSDGNPATDDLGFDHYINSTSFKIQSLTTVGNYQFVAYYDQGTTGANRNVTIARRNITSPGNLWHITHTAFTSFNSTDAHNVISIGVDGDGYLHLSWGMHNNNLLYTRSTAPVTNGNPMSFVGQSAGNSGAVNTMTGMHETSVTYPNFYNIPGSDDLLFNYRTGSSGDGVYRISKYDTASGDWTFTRASWIENTDPSGLNYNAYPHNMVYDSSGGLHATWTFRYNSDSPAGESGFQTNHNIYYGYSPDHGATWYRDPAGTVPYSGPINDATSEIVVAIPEGSSFINTGTMALDTSGNPLVATYWAPGANDAAPDHRRQYMLAYYDGDEWKTSQITNRRVDDPRAKISEGQLPNSWMGRPQVLVDDYNRAYVVYNDNEGMTNVTVAVSQAASRDDWEFFELTNVPTTQGADTIELTADRGRWEQDRTLSLFYQPQVGGNGSVVSVLEWPTQQALGRVLTWTGATSATWDTSSVNFTDLGAPDNFDEFDHVTFGDDAQQKVVSLAGDVRAGKVVVDSSGTYTITGPGRLTAGSLSVVGGGTLELANAGNSYSGPTRVSNATLRITGNANGMVSPIIVAAGGTVMMDASDASTMASTFDVWRTGELHIGSPTSTGNVFPDNPESIVNDGVIRAFTSDTLSNVSGNGAIVAEAGTLTLHSNPAFAGTVVVKAGAAVVAQNSAALGSGGLAIAGSGTDAGALHVLSGAAIDLHGDVVFSSGQAVVAVEAGAALNLHGDIIGSGGLTKSSPGTLRMIGEGTYEGPTEIAFGTLQIDGATGDGDTTVNAGGTLAGRGMVRGDLIARAGSVVRPAAVNPGEPTGPTMIDDFSSSDLSAYNQFTVLNFDGAVESTFARSAGGITAGTTDTGNSPEQAALVRPFDGLAVGETLVVDAAIDPNNGTPRAVNLFDYGLLVADSDGLTQGSRNQYLYSASRLSNNPDIMLARYWDIDSADGSAGDVNVNGGAGVDIESPAATQFYIRRTGATTYQLGYSTDNMETLIQYGEDISVEASFEPDLVGFYSDARGGNGTTTQTAEPGIFDNLRIERDGPVSSVFTVAGDFLLESGATLALQLNRIDEYSQVIVEGALVADGTLQIALGPNYVPAAGDEFDLLDFGSLSGDFTSIELPSLATGLKWNNSMLVSDGVLQIVAGIAGDYNASGIVDAADYVVWRRAVGTSGAGLAADGNGDFNVDQHDYALWRMNFGASLSAESARLATVPEPSSRFLLLAALAAGGVLLGSTRSWSDRAADFCQKSGKNSAGPA